MLNTHRWLCCSILVVALLLLSACGQGLPLGTPTPILGPLTLEEQNALASQRKPAFANALTASIEVLSVEVQFENQVPHVVLNMRITVKNISDTNLVIRKPTRFGFGNFGGCDDDVVHKSYREDGKLIEMPLVRVDCLANIPQSQDEFVTLEKGQSASYTYQLIPTNMLLDDNQELDHVLPPGSYFISATYDNSWVGYATQSESATSLIADLNAWVGEISSVQVPFVVPPYEVPTETFTR